jgi:ABC-type nitrate/sulfonate/bicarbonate transport system substrate-binding protein
MARQPLRIGGYRYEHTEPLFDGRVSIEGVDAVFDSSPLVSDVFYKMVKGEYDVAELGLTYFLRIFDTEESPFLALPIFPNRNFRHSAIFINTGSGIDKPDDLAGRTIGEFALYGHDPGVWVKGILSDEYGVRPESCRWVIGGTDHPIPSFTWIPQPVPDGVDVRHAPDGVTLASMLEAGEIDALISNDVPQAVLNGSAAIARLFADYESVERDYYRRTGIFPPMHVIAIRRELAGQPGLAAALCRAYSQAKELVQRAYTDGAAKQHPSVITPWFSELFAENRALLGQDWWPYGLKRNLTAVDTFLRYHYEQGLSRRRLSSQDIFVPELLDS